MKYHLTELEGYEWTPLERSAIGIDRSAAVLRRLRGVAAEFDGKVREVLADSMVDLEGSERVVLEVRLDGFGVSISVGHNL